MEVLPITNRDPYQLPYCVKIVFPRLRKYLFNNRCNVYVVVCVQKLSLHPIFCVINLVRMVARKAVCCRRKRGTHTHRNDSSIRDVKEKGNSKYCIIGTESLNQYLTKIGSNRFRKSGCLRH